MDMDLKTIHDQLLTAMPSGAHHDATVCQLCSVGAEIETVSPETAITNNTIETPEGGAMSDKTYTEDDVQTAVAKATADLASELAEVKASLSAKDHEVETANAVEAAVAEKDAEIAALQAKLDTAVLEAGNAKKELADLSSLIEEEKARAEREAELAARRDERLAKVAAVASFPEDYVKTNADRWAAMSDEDFEALCADYAAVSNKETAAEEDTVVPPRETAMVGEREIRTPATKLDATKSVLGLALQGVDFRSL